MPPETSARLYATLSTDERSRSARLRFPRDRQHFIVAHGVLRDLLGRYLQTQPDRIRYVYNAFGKPELGPEFQGRLGFNLSHSAGLALIAIAPEPNVGVDVECVRPRAGYAEIAQRFFSAAEVDQLRAVPEPLYAEAFLACWTKKEAYAKARGSGLTTWSGAAANDIIQAPWSVHALRPAPGHVGALVIEGEGWRLAERQWHVRQY